MSTRLEKVVLELEDRFTAKMLEATAATGAADQALAHLDGTAVKTDRSTTHLGGNDGGIAKTGRQARAASNDLNKYTGRLNLLLSAATVLGPSLVPITAGLIPAVTGLAAGFGAAAGTAGVAMLAFNGIGDAVKAVNAYALEPTNDNLDAIRQKLQDVGPSGRELVQFLAQLKPDLEQLQATARDGLLPGVEQGIKDLLPLLPQVHRMVSDIATEAGSLAEQAGQGLANDDDFQRFFDYVEHNAAPVMDDFAKATGDVAAGLASLLVDMAPLTNQFDRGLLNAARDFRQWAAGLDQTKGFRDFLAYVEQEGPQVVDLLGALGKAFLGIVHAAQPVGDIVLPTMTAVANVFAALAKSPLGPVLYDAAAAMIVFNRAVGLLGLGGAAGAGAGGLLGSLGKARLGFRGLATDIRGAAAAMGQMATVSLVAGANTEREAAMMAGATARLRTSALGIGGRLAPAAGIGGTLLLANGATTKNTAASAAQTIGGGALLGGSIGLELGPEGAAIGAAIGALGGGLITLATHLNDTSDAVKKVTVDWSNLNATLDSNGNVTAQTKLAIGQTLLSKGLLNAGNKAGVTDTESITAASGNPTVLKAALAASQSKQVQLQRQLAGAQQAGTIWLPGGGYAQTKPELIKSLQQQIQAQKDYQKSLKDAADSIDTESASTQRLNAAMGRSTLSIRDQIAAQQTLHQQDLANFDAVTAWGQAVQEAAKQAATGARGLNQYTAAGAANRQALSGMIEAWNAQPAKVRNNVSEYEAARRKLIQLAAQMGATKGQIQALTADLDKPKKLIIGVQDQGVLDQITKIKTALDSIPTSLRTKYYVDQIGLYNKRQAMDQELHKANGGFITGPGGPRDDQVPAWLSNGEFVVNAAATARNRGLLEQINAQQYATGGFVQPPLYRGRLALAAGGVVTSLVETTPNSLEEML